MRKGKDTKILPFFFVVCYTMGVEEGVNMTFLEFAPIFVYRFVVVLLGFAGIILFPFFGVVGFYFLGLFDRELFKGNFVSAIGWLLGSIVCLGLFVGSIYFGELVLSWR